MVTLVKWSGATFLKKAAATAAIAAACNDGLEEKASSKWAHQQLGGSMHVILQQAAHQKHLLALCFCNSLVVI